MDKFYPPYFPCYIPLPNGKPAAGGKLYAYYTGTDNLAPLYAEDGTILVGSVEDIDSSGQVHVLLDPAITYRLKVVPPVGSQMPDQIYDNVRVANGTIVGMENPMTEQGDMIVGGAAGAPIRLAHPGGIRFLRAAVVSGIGKVLQWVGLTAGQHITITHDVAGTTISADDQDGDHKVKAGAADNAPGVLYDKIGSITAPNGYIRKQLHTDVDGNQTLRLGIDATSATDGQVLTAHEIDGVCDPQWAAIPTQPGDHQLLVSATDASAGYLGAKLTPGSNITLTPQTDGDGVQTLEISATGGGGGGGSACLQFAPLANYGFCQIAMNAANTMSAYHISFLRKIPFVCKFSRIYFMIYNDANGAYTTANVGLYYRDTNGDYVAASRQMGLQLKHKLRTGANTGDPSFYIDLATPMDTTDGSRNYRLVVQFLSTTKPTTALNFYPDASYNTPPVLGTEQPFTTNGYYLNINNSGQTPQNIWLIQNRYWAENEIGDTLINIPTSPVQHVAMPWMAVE